MNRWLSEVIKPNREATTWCYYDLMARAYITPSLGKEKLDKLTVRDVQRWLNRIPAVCQCCAQGKDAKRAEGRRKCCAVGKCCEDFASRNTIRAARDTLRAALSHAMAEKLLTRNVAMLVKLLAPRKRTRKGSSWSVEEARRFLVFCRNWNNDLYALWVLILVLGLRKGEALGLCWADVDLVTGELSVEWQLQRVGARPLLHKQRAAEELRTRFDVWRYLPRPSRVMIWSPVQTGHFLDSAINHRLYALFHLITFRGLRRGEACGLEWEDLDLDAGTLTVRVQRVAVSYSEIEEGEPKTDASEDAIPLDKATVAVLRRHRVAQNAEKLQWGEAWVNSGKVFTWENGEPLHPDTVFAEFLRVAYAAGLPPIRLHDLRHGAATLMLAGART